MSCPECRIGRPVEINLAVEGRALRMRRCTRCGERWWDLDGERVAIGVVLSGIASQAELARRG